MACTKRLKRRTRIHFVCPEGGELTERKTKGMEKERKVSSTEFNSRCTK